LSVSTPHSSTSTERSAVWTWPRKRAECTGRAFTARMVELELTHLRIPPRSPNHNAVCERFQGSMLTEVYRPHFHRVRVDTLAQFDAAAQAWVADYNQRRRSRGSYIAREVFSALPIPARA
jgi:transposase InsO family protein